MFPQAKRDLKHEKSKQLNSLPLRYENNRSTNKYDIRNSNKQNFSKTNSQNEAELKNSGQGIRDSKHDSHEYSSPERSIPIAGTLIIKETYLSSDEESEQEPAFGILDKKQKVLVKNGFPKLNHKRSKSSMVQQQKNSFVEDKNSQTKTTNLTSTVPLKTPPNETVKENFDNMFDIALKKREAEESKTMESRRVPDSDSSLIVTTVGTDSQNRRKGNLTKLIGKQMEGDEDFFEGTMIRGLKSGFCRILYSSYLFKEGFFVNGQLEGEGSLKYPNGVTINGIFRNGNLQSNIILSIDTEIFQIDYMDGEYHNDQLFVNEKGLLFITIKPCENINEYTGKIKIYFRNYYKLDATYEKGVLSENFESTLYDKFDNPLLGKIRHGINAEINGIFIFKPTADPENEYLMLFKGECKVVRKHKK